MVPAAIHQCHPLCCFSCWFWSVCVKASSIAKPAGLQVSHCKNRFVLRNNHKLNAVVQIRPSLVSTSLALKRLLVVTEGVLKTQCACGWVSSLRTRELTRASVHIPMTLLWFKPRWKYWCLCTFSAFSFMVVLTHILKIHLYLSLLHPWQNCLPLILRSVHFWHQTCNFCLGKGVVFHPVFLGRSAFLITL